MIINIPPTHTPLRQLADFLQRGRCDGQYTRKTFWSASYFTKLYHTATSIWLCGKSVGTLRRRSNRKVINTMDTSLKEEQRLLKKAQCKLRMEQSRSYRAMKTATKVMDDYYLDPILGLVPVIGDIVPQLFNASFFYISIFKIRSYALTMTLLRNVFIDIFVGLIPYAGIVLDIFYKSYRENTILIEGFVNDDPNIVKKVKRRAVSTTIWLVVLGVAIYYLIVFLWSVVTHLYQWIMSYI